MFRPLDDAQDFFLDGILSDQTLPRRRMPDIRFGPRAAELMSRDAVEEHEHVGVLLQAAVADRRFDPPLPEDLHGSDPAAARFWMICCRRTLLDHDAIDAEPVEQQRHCKPDRATAGDEYGRLACFVRGDAHARFLPVFIWAETALILLSHKNMFDMVAISI